MASSTKTKTARVFSVILTLFVAGCSLGPEDLPTPPPPAAATDPSQPKVEKYEPIYDPDVIEELIRTTPDFQDWRYVYQHIATINDLASLGPGITMEADFSPTVNLKKAEEVIDAYEQAMGMWTFFGLEDVPVVWTIMSEVDYEWWYERVKAIEGPRPALDVWDPATNRMGHCYPTATTFCGYGNPSESAGLTFQYNIIGSQYVQPPNRNTVHHEAVHFYQDGLHKNYDQFMPCWFVEGQASLIGNAIATNDARAEGGLGPESSLPDVSRLGGDLPGDKTWSIEQWKSVLDAYTFDEDARNECRELSYNYTLGSAVFEYLYGTYSMMTIHELLVNAAASENWEGAVEETLDVSVDQLNERLAGYLYSIHQS